VDGRDTGSSHFCVVVMVPFHPALVCVKVGASDALIETKVEPWSGRKGVEGKEGVDEEEEEKGRRRRRVRMVRRMVRRGRRRRRRGGGG